MEILVEQHANLVEENKAALLEHREHLRLVKLAAKMSDDDYEHAGPVDKSDIAIKLQKTRHTTLQSILQGCRAELGACFCACTCCCYDRMHNWSTCPWSVATFCDSSCSLAC